VKSRQSNGALSGLMIYDKRDKEQPPTTVIAKRGVLLTEGDAYQVIVYDGSRQVYNTQTGVLQRLDFQRYTIDLPTSGNVRQRWQEPEERTIFELLNPDLSAAADVVILQGLFIAVYNVAQNSDFGIVLMYGVVFLPGLASLYMLTGFGDATRRKLFYTSFPAGEQGESL